MSDKVLLLTLLVVLGGLGYGGSELVKQLSQINTPASTARPAGTDTGPGWIYVAPGPADKDQVLSAELRLFLSSFDTILEALSEKMSDAAERRLNDLENEERRASTEDPERKINNAADEEDTNRRPDDPDSRPSVDEDPDRKINNAADEQDTNRRPDDPDSRPPVDEDPDRKINNAADEQDTNRSPDDPDSRPPVDGNPENQINRVAASQDNLRSTTNDPDSRVALEGNPENEMNRVAAAEDNLRSITNEPESRAPVDANPESEINRVAATEGSRLAPASAFDEKFDFVSESKIRAFVDDLDTAVEVVEGRQVRRLNMFKRLVAASTVSTDLVEGRVFNSDGRVKPLSETPPGQIRYNSDAAGAFGTSPSLECRETPKGREIIATQLSQSEIRARRTPRGTMMKIAALRAAGIVFDALGSVGDIMDVFQIVQVFGNGAYYDPDCTLNPGTCKFPTEFLTANQAKDISKLVVKKQIDTLDAYVPKDPDFKPRFPLIRGPLDVLSADPYQNQTLIQLQVDAVQNRLLNADPWRGKFLTYFGSQTVINEIMNDPRNGLSYYTSKAGMTNQEIDSVYEIAFSNVCLQNKGKVWIDQYISGRPRLQCGFTEADCNQARRQYFSSSSRGNYVEWYTYTDINSLLASMTPAVNPPYFTKKPTDENGFCMVSSPGTAALCNYYKGEYDGVTHKCEFTLAYCQSIGTCHNSVDKTCYLPGPQMEALNFFFAGGGVREWIKVNGCTFVGNDADKASYTFQSIGYTFVPITMLFTAGGRKMFQDAIANSKNWGPGIKSQLNDPMVGVGFASAIIGLSTVVAVSAASAGILTGSAAAAATGVGLPVAFIMILAAGVTISVTMMEAKIESDLTAKVDKEDYALFGLQKSVVDAATALANPGSVAGTYYVPIGRGYASGWVTRKLPVTKKADGTLCTAVENYTNPTLCREVASTAEIPYVFVAPFTSIITKEPPNYVPTSSQKASFGRAYEFGHKTQCWKYDYTFHRTDRYGTTIEKSTDAAFGTIPVGKAYGEPYGTIDAAMNNKVLDGYIRAGTLGSDKKTWCMRRRPEATIFDATIGTPAVETEYTMNRSWTSKIGDAGLYYPEYPTEAASISAALHNHFRYQLVYATDSIPVNTMWDNLLMDAIFTESTVAEIRRYYCEQELIRFSSDTSQIDKRCYGYLSLGITGYAWFAMSLPGKVSSSFNTITGTVTMGTVTQDNRDNLCAVKYGVNYEEDSKGLCYLNCNYGTGATNDTYASVSREWKSDSSMGCYKQYPKWEDNGRGHGEQTITKKIFVSDYIGIPNDCPADKEKNATGLLCHRKCSSLNPNLYTARYEYLNDGNLLCYAHDKWWENEASRKGRWPGIPARTPSTMNKPMAFMARWKGLKSLCQPGYSVDGVFCYTNCDTDQYAVGSVCYDYNCPPGTTEKTAMFCTSDCPSGQFWDQSACYNDCRTNFYRSSIGFCIESCHDISYSGLTAPTKEITAGVCTAYNFNCPSSYDTWGAGSSTPTCYRPPESRLRSKYCPNGYYRSAEDFCEKDRYGIGAGTFPDINGNCSGGVREYISGLCYNPCQPRFNSGMQCPADAFLTQSGSNSYFQFDRYCARWNGTQYQYVTAFKHAFLAPWDCVINDGEDLNTQPVSKSGCDDGFYCNVCATDLYCQRNAHSIALSYVKDSYQNSGDMSWPKVKPKGSNIRDIGDPPVCPPCQTEYSWVLGTCYEDCNITAGIASCVNGQVVKNTGKEVFNYSMQSTGLCNLDCPWGYADGGVPGTFCYVPPESRGAGTPLECSGRWQQKDGSCYTPCNESAGIADWNGTTNQLVRRAGYDYFNYEMPTAGLCSQECPPGATDVGVFCARQSYFRAVGKEKGY